MYVCVLTEHRILSRCRYRDHCAGYKYEEMWREKSFNSGKSETIWLNILHTYLPTYLPAYLQLRYPHKYSPAYLSALTPVFVTFLPIC